MPFCGIPAVCVCVLNIIVCLQPAMKELPQFTNHSSVREIIIRHSRLSTLTLPTDMWPHLKRIDIRNTPLLSCHALHTIGRRGIVVRSECPNKSSHGLAIFSGLVLLFTTVVSIILTHQSVKKQRRERCKQSLQPLPEYKHDKPLGGVAHTI